jgi:WD40 repeat protein
LEHDDLISSMVTSSDSNLVTTTSGSALRRWDLSSRRELLRVNMPSRILLIAASKDDRWIATADAEGIQVWLAEAGATVALSKRSDVLSVAFAPNSQTVLASGPDSLITKWQWNEGPEYGESSAAGSPSSFSTDGSRALNIHRAPQPAAPPPRRFDPLGSVRVDQPAPITAISIAGTSDTNTEVYLPIKGTPQFASLSPNGKYAAVYVGSQIEIYDTSSGRLMGSLNHPRTGSLAISPDGRTIAAGLITPADSVTVLRADGQTLAEIPANIARPQFSPDGKFLALSMPGIIEIFETTSFKMRSRIEQAGAGTIAFTPDGTYIAGVAGTSVRLWEAGTGTLRSAVKVNSIPNTIAFSGDGKYLVAGSNDGIRVLLWRPEDLVTEACSRARTKQFTPEEWKSYFADEPFHATCPAIGAPAYPRH